MDKFSFENLEVYGLVRRLVVKVYGIIHKLPATEKFALSSQLQRSIVSVLSNIAEGSGRISIKEKIHFIEISYGSLMEAYAQLQICCDLNYINEECLKVIKQDFFRISLLLSGLRKSFVKKISIDS
ncbi:MAG: four helix bundle protein [Muribaculaceae bacterium]|nr:four helix bundle protein [Muribaculaceae bacterium]MDE6298588.1 four helix bundle protein [Muribaculaceae bacterium]